MNRTALAILLPFFLTLGATNHVWCQQDSASAVMDGISNEGKNQTDPYAAAGDRSYIIGTQDGNFPDLGGHVPREMGGLWIHPIKLVDGFWARVSEEGTDQQVQLQSATEFINYPYGNRFRYGTVVNDVEIERFQFSPDGYPGAVMQYVFRNKSGVRRSLGLELAVKTDLLPVWFSDHLGIEDAPDTVVWDRTRHRFQARDTRHHWFALWGAVPSDRARPVDYPQPMPTKGIGATAASRHPVTLEPHDSATLTFVIAGSATTKAEAESAYAYLARHHSSLLARKKDHYRAIVRRGRITIPDRRLQEVYDWVKVNAEWMVREVPGIGRGLGAGLMEYPWWFGTEGYSLLALAVSGDYTVPKQTLRLLRSQSAKANGNGRILHEVTTNGGVSNPGNTQETALFIMSVAKLVQWSGDLSFAREMYPAMTSGLHWLLSEVDRNRNLFPEGYGIMEVLGLNAEVIDVAVYTQQELLATSGVAAMLGKTEAAERYRRTGAQLATRIEQSFWIEEEGSYGDFYGTKAQAISTAEGAIKQIQLKGANELTDEDKRSITHYEQLKQRFAAMPDSSRAWITNRNWVISTPVEVGIAPRDRALRLLDQVREKNVGEYGPYLSAVEKQRMMTISTGVQAVAEARYGRVDQALWYMNKIVETFGRKLPGSVSEMMPDYGCFAISWTAYGIVVPLIEQIFGIRADAPHKTVVFEPQLPQGWEDLSIQDLPVGVNLVSFSRAKTDKGIEYTIEAKQSGWSFVLKDGLPGGRYTVNGKAVSPASSGIRMTGRSNRVLLVR